MSLPEGSEPLVTAAAVVVDPARHTLRYSLAGHLPPLIREPSGSVRILDQASGMLLGLGTRGRHNHEASYAPGSHLRLFTDGLIERRDESLTSGLERLANELQASHQPDPVKLCDVLVRKITPRNGREDDTAILCALLSLPVPTVKGCNNPFSRWACSAVREPRRLLRPQSQGGLRHRGAAGLIDRYRASVHEHAVLIRPRTQNSRSAGRPTGRRFIELLAPISS